MQMIQRKIVKLEWPTYSVSITLWALVFHKRALGFETEFLENTLNQKKFVDEMDPSEKEGLIQELNCFDTLADILTICHSNISVINPSHFKLKEATKTIHEVRHGGLYYKYYDSKEGTLGALKDPSIKFAFPQNWNDVFEANFMNDAKDWGVLDTNFLVGSCFSTKWDNLLMWSHYAASFKGFCVGYQIMERMFYERSVAVASELWPVSYYQHAPSFPHPADALIITSKSIDWSYEDEYRLIVKDHIPGFYPIDPHVIREVILGPQNENISLLDTCNELKTKAEYLKVFRAKKANGRYGLQKEEFF